MMTAAGNDLQVSVSLTQTLLDTAHTLGVTNRDTLLSHIGLDQALLEKPENRIPFALQEQLWGIASTVTAIPTIGLEFGRRSRISSFGLVGYLGTNCATFGEAFNMIEQYQQLIGQGGRLHQYPSETHHELRYHPLNQENNIAPYRVEGVLASLYQLGQHVSGRIFQPERVCFTHQAADLLRVYEEYFQCPVEFNQPFNGLLFTREIVSTAIPLASQELFTLIRSQADRQLITLEHYQGISRKASELIKSQLLAGGDVNKKLIAQQMGLSSRTLQRRLTEENCSWQSVLNQTRHNLALLLLDSSDHSISNIGATLGFAEPSAFYRAFRQWHNMTPGAYRRKLKAETNTVA